MADSFELLSLPARVSLNEVELQHAYFEATKTAHPDQVGGDAQLSADLNAALEMLKSPVTRLKHLIDTRSGLGWRAIPLEAGLMSLFEKLGPLLQQVTAFLTYKQAATSALAKALLASEEMRLREELEALNEAIEDEWQRLEAMLPGCDERLAADDSTVWPELQALQAKFAYLTKWRAQIREKLLGLML